MIIGGKSQFKRVLRPSRKSAGIGFELGQHLLFAQHENKIAGLSTDKLDTVDRARKIRSDAIAVCRRPFDLMEMLALLAQDLQRLVDFGIAHRERGADRKSTRLNSSHLGISY